MSKLMAILVIIFLCISCTDNAELPVKPDKNEGTENVLIELAVTVPAGHLYPYKGDSSYD